MARISWSTVAQIQPRMAGMNGRIEFLIWNEMILLLFLWNLTLYIFNIHFHKKVREKIVSDKEPLTLLWINLSRFESSRDSHNIYKHLRKFRKCFFCYIFAKIMP